MANSAAGEARDFDTQFRDPPPAGKVPASCDDMTANQGPGRAGRR